MTFSARFVSSLLEVAVSRGARRRHLQELANLGTTEVVDEEARIDVSTYNRFLEAAMLECNDPLFGLHAGESLNINAAGLIAQLVQSCANIRQALELCCEFAMLGCRALPMNLCQQPDGVLLAVTPDRQWLDTAPEIVKQTVDGVLAFSLREYQSLVHFKHNPLAVYLQTSAANHRSEYYRVFNCPVIFDAEQNGLLLPQEMLEQKIDSANYELLNILVQFAQKKVAAQSHKTNFERQVRNAILALMNPRFPNAEKVAAHLNISLRSLQRQLKDADTSFRQILESLRIDFALKYLRNKDFSIAEVAELLNYSDSANFIRAFKRKYDLTPMQWRKQQNYI